MAKFEEVSWGKYREYEGPYWRGRHSYKLPENPSENDKILAVLTATEGGRWDAYNGYDVCISTSGLIQWCERGQYSVSDMLGEAAEKNRSLIKSVDDQASASGLTFKKNARNRWRFFFEDERGEVDRREEQRQMFLLHSDGKQGTWDEESKLYAKKWASAISSVWENPEAQKVQGEFTAARLNWFALPFAKSVLAGAPDTPIGHAFKAAYISFAANNPTWANKHLEVGMKDTGHQMWTKDWLTSILQELTFGPKITIYPHRYDKIRPVLEKLYGLDLIDFSRELKTWKDEMGGGDDFLTDLEIQEFLIELGFDLGPSGADGKFGKKSRQALISFQQIHGLEATGYPDFKTRDALRAQKEAAAQTQNGLSDEDRKKIKSIVALSVAKMSKEAMENQTK
jgi:hypothetical protein